MKTLIALFFLLLELSIFAEKEPNILLIIADDCTYSDLPIHGGININTPNIDKLASEGMTFNNAYVTMSMCVTCRSELYTGLSPFSNGSLWNHSHTYPKTPSIVNHLRKRNYRIGIAGKIHVFPETNFPFEKIDGVERNPVANTAEYDGKQIENFITRDRKQAFCLVVGFTMPHVPWTVGDASAFDEMSIKLPDYIADTKLTRQAYCAYLAEIVELDHQFGLLMSSLEASGEADNTIIVFTSEQGAQFPFCKWTNYNNGVHTSMIVKWQDQITANTRSGALVQYSDILPTLLDLVDGDTSDFAFDGSSFKDVLLEGKKIHRDYAYFIHNNVPEGTPYPIRSITDGSYHYIRNLNCQAFYTEKHMMGDKMLYNYWAEWMFDAAINEKVFDSVTRYMKRPYEELYDLKNDVNERHNLIENPQYFKEKVRLSSNLDQWLEDNGDTGLELDTWQQYRKNNRMK